LKADTEARGDWQNVQKEKTRNLTLPTAPHHSFKSLQKKEHCEPKRIKPIQVGRKREAQIPKLDFRAVGVTGRETVSRSRKLPRPKRGDNE